MVLWHISNHVSLAGDGGMRASGRWHTRGRRVVYGSETPAAALLEILVHFEIDVRNLPTRYRLLKLHAPDDLVVEGVATEDLPTDWPERTDFTRATGDRWLQMGRSPLLRVPSAVVPETFNLLLNPGHKQSGRVRVVQISEHAIDPRLLK
ncbi:MAG TPA: RES family NAD+ phosphorylase [Vicinamibacterales bacterium]|nr:RES family NAD+ phosphorylase [Vicinamibacterales bacterium]